MKFAAVIVLLAIAFSVDGHVLPLSAVTWTHAVPEQSLTVSQPVVAARLVSAWDVAPAHTVVAHTAPAVHAYAAAPVAVVAAPVAVEGQYVAANRGSVHVAPLPGHSQSASSVNLEPAPGTW